MSEQLELPATFVRGGTSKGVFLDPRDLPADFEERRRLLARLMGSPDLRQIDGMGGGDSHTSKVCLVAPSARPDADVDYTFIQVGITEASIDEKGICGNLTSAVAAHAVDEGWVKNPPEGGRARVLIWSTNLGRPIRAEVPVKDGRAAVAGEYRIAGVPYPGARINLDFALTAGAVTGKLYPTGEPIVKIRLGDGREVAAGLLDLVNPVVHVAAAEAGLAGPESPAEISANKEVMDRLAEIRERACLLFGLAASREEARERSPFLPLVAVVSPPASYDTFDGRGRVEAGEIDLTLRMLNLGRVHKSTALSAAVNVAAASRLVGTVAASVARPRAPKGPVALGHPQGRIEIDVEIGPDGRLARAAVGRTARRLMQGRVYVPRT